MWNKLIFDWVVATDPEINISTTDIEHAQI